MVTTVDTLIIGGTGYGGAELIKRVLSHPNLRLKAVTSIDEVGRPVGDIHLNLAHRTDLKFENTPIRDAVTKYKPQCVLLSLPHKVTFTLAPQILDMGVKIVDMSGDYRLDSAEEYKKYYGVAHTNPENLSKFTYGLVELFREQIKKASFVASPGCFATCTALGLAPLARGGLLKSQNIRTLGITGSSGSGAYPSPTTHHPLRSNNLKAYKPLDHQHIPEIDRCLRMNGATDIHLDFVPVSAPLSRGILVNSFIDVPDNVTSKTIDDLIRKTYEGCPFIKYVTERQPEVVAVKGTNYCEIGFTLGKEANAQKNTKTLVVTTALDNLIKGGAGQSIQNVNCMFGLPETAGLDEMGLWP